MAIIKLNNQSISSVTALPTGVGGKVLQVVSATDGTDRSTTSSSWVTGSNTLIVNITPSSTSSKIFVVCSTTAHLNTTPYARYFTIFRNSTNLGQVNNGMSAIYAENNADTVSSLVMSYLDSPNSTSILSYQLYMKGVGQTAFINWNATVGSITAYEIAG